MLDTEDGLCPLNQECGPKSKSTEASGTHFQDERGGHESGYEVILIVYIMRALHF
jgi:hypothetical protein